MKRTVVTLLISGFLFISLISCDTDQNTDSPDKNFFIKYYGDDGNQSGADMIVLGDGSILLLGNSEQGTSKKIYLVNVDATGNIIWQKTLKGNFDVAKDIEPTNDGNFVILATFEKSVDDHDIKLIIVQPDGTEIDTVVYGSPKKDNPKSVTPLIDGGFIVTGSTQYDTANFNPTNPDDFSNIFHFRCNANLDFDVSNWYELYGATDKFDAATKVIQETNDRFYVFGYSNQEHDTKLNDKLNLQYYLIGAGGTINSNPNFLGDFDQDTRSAYVMEVPQELGGGFFQIGTKTSTSGIATLHVSKLRSPLRFNSIDDEQLDEDIDVVPRQVEAVSAAASLSTPFGYLLLAEEVRNVGTKNILLTKIDQSGIPKWTVSLGSEEENDEAAAVIELPDGKILVLGTVELGDNQNKMALFKLNSSGRLHD